MSVLPNRVALYLGAAAAFLGGLAPVVANLDGTSTAGVIAGVTAIATFVNNYVHGYQKHEARQAGELEAPDPEVTVLAVDDSQPDQVNIGQP